MKRYWLFAGDAYESAGGMKDFVADFDTVPEAHNYLARGDWAHIFDSHTGRIVMAREQHEPWQEIDKVLNEWY